MTTRKKLCTIKGISEAKMEKIKEAANKLIDPGFLTALEYADRRKAVFNITTGSQELECVLIFTYMFLIVSSHYDLYTVYYKNYLEL